MFFKMRSFTSFRMTFIIWVSCLLFIACGPSLQEVVKETELSPAFKHNQEKIHSFRGVARVFFSFGKKKGSVEVLVVSEKPDHLRMETGNFFGVPLSVLTIYQGKVTYYVIPEEKYYVGEAKEQVTQQFLPFELTEENIFGLIYFSQKTYDFFKHHKRFQLDFYEVKEKEELKLFYPRGFKLTDKKTKDTVEWRWDAYDLNPPKFSSMHFKIEKPAQARWIDLRGAHKTSPIFKGEEESE